MYSHSYMYITIFIDIVIFFKLLNGIKTINIEQMKSRCQNQYP